MHNLRKQRVGRGAKSPPGSSSGESFLALSNLVQDTAWA